MLKVAHGVQGKILASESEKRFIVVEQKGKDLWRGRHKSLDEAIKAGEASVGVDRTLLQRARKYDVENVVVFVEELRRIYVAPLELYFDDEKSSGRTSWRGRPLRLIGFENLLHHYVGPDLQRKRKRAS